MMTKPLILIVDDEEDIRQSVKDVLEDNNFRVLTAKDGSDALKQLQRHAPDLLLLDILMPGLTTQEILAKIKVKIPIVFLTVVKLSEATKKELIRKSMKDYIEKPFNNDDLIRRIRKALQQK